MPKERLSIARWQEAVAESPERVADRLLGELELATVETRRALFAAIPERGRLIENLQFALSQGDGPLRGVPYMLQDLFDVRGLPTACGAPFAEPFEAPLEESCLLYQELKGGAAAFLRKGPGLPSSAVQHAGRNRPSATVRTPPARTRSAGAGPGPRWRAVDDGLGPARPSAWTRKRGGMRVPTAFHGLFGYRMAPNRLRPRRRLSGGAFDGSPPVGSRGSLADLPPGLSTAFHPAESLSAPANAAPGAAAPRRTARLLETGGQGGAPAE